VKRFNKNKCDIARSTPIWLRILEVNAVFLEFPVNFTKICNAN
jgi:hypothetical protein